MKILNKYEPPKSKEDVICMLGDTEGDKHRVFMDIGPKDIGKTISVGKYFQWMFFGHTYKNNYFRDIRFGEKNVEHVYKKP